MIIKVRTSYLEMLNKKDFIPKPGFDKKIQIKEVENSVFINLMMFLGVGLPWRWYSRLTWTENEWNHYLNHSISRLFLAFSGATLIGYYELEFQDQGNVEIKFFGLLPEYIGSGLGSMLLSHAINSAWAADTKRVWVHTCDLDSTNAISNYQSRGFKIFREEINDENVPDQEQLLKLISDFFQDYIHKYSDKN